MKKNVSGQTIGAQMVSATDGSAFTGSVTVYVTGDGGTQAVGSVGSGACTHEGNGYHTYAPAQAETNYDLTAFTFIGTGAVPVTIQVFNSFPQTGDSYARLGAPAGASVSADIATIDGNVDSILVDTAEIGAAGAGLTAVPWNASWDAEVQSECADALTAYDPPTKTEMDSGFAALNDIAATDIVSNGAITTLAGAVVNVYLVDVCTTNTDMRGTDSAYTGTPPTAGAIADQVWEEAIADHSGTSGSTAESLAAAGGSGDPWVTSLPGSYTGTQAGKILADILTDTGTTIPGQLDDMSGATFDTATDSLEAIRNRGDSAWAGGGSAPTVSEIRIEMDTNSTQLAKLGTPAGASMSADIAAVKSDTGAILTDTGTTIPASISSLPTATENADALLNRDMSAVSDTNARSPLNALRFLRNKWGVSGTTLTVRKEDDSTAAWTATVTADAAADPITGSDPA